MGHVAVVSNLAYKPLWVRNHQSRPSYQIVLLPSLLEIPRDQETTTAAAEPECDTWKKHSWASWCAADWRRNFKETPRATEGLSLCEMQAWKVAQGLAVAYLRHRSAWDGQPCVVQERLNYEQQTSGHSG